MTVCLLAFTTTTTTTTTNTITTTTTTTTTTITGPTNAITVVNSYTLIFTHTHPNTNKNVQGQNEHILTPEEVQFGNIAAAFVQNTSLGIATIVKWKLGLFATVTFILLGLRKKYRQVWLTFKTISGYKSNLQTENEHFYKYLSVLMSKQCSWFQHTCGLEKLTKPLKEKFAKHLMEYMEIL
uniref:Uncharacterized protein n=1 Tax=Glossina pallidipes TaxID=7398 RepID=A0A1A9ZAF9_GLOPL